MTASTKPTARSGQRSRWADRAARVPVASVAALGGAHTGVGEHDNDRDRPGGAGVVPVATLAPPPIDATPPSPTAQEVDRYRPLPVGSSERWHTAAPIRMPSLAFSHSHWSAYRSPTYSRRCPGSTARTSASGCGKVGVTRRRCRGRRQRKRDGGGGRMVATL